MAITKEEALSELKALHQVYSDASRRVLALTMRMQHMPDSAFTERTLLQVKLPEDLPASQASELALKMGQGEVTITGDKVLINSPHTEIAAAASAMAAQASQQMPMRTPHPHDGVLDRDGKTTQPQVAHVWQLNTFEPIDEARAQTPVSTALDSAKSLLKTAMRNAGHPDSVIDMVDKVGVEHLAAKAANQEADYVVPREDRVQLPTEVGYIKIAPAADAAQAEAEIEQGILSAFIGKGSVFMEHLDASMMFNARGDIKPDGETIKRYGNDARWINEANLCLWPTGFYLDKDTKQLQFLVNTDQCAVLLTSLPSEVSPVLVFFYGLNDGWKEIAQYSVSEQKLIHAKVQDTLSGLKKK
jgi:hypothetical protein